MPAASDTAPLISLHVTEWTRLCEAAGLQTDAQRAAFLGTTRQTVNLVQNGRKSAGERFISSVLTKLPGARFERVFRINEAAL